MGHIRVFKQLWFVLSVLVIGGLFFSVSASAQEVLVISQYQEKPAKNKQFSKVMSNDVIKKIAGAKDLKSKTFFYNPATGEWGSVLVWNSQTDWDAYKKSALRNELVSKMKPFLKGTVSSTSYPVFN